MRTPRRLRPPRRPLWVLRPRHRLDPEQAEALAATWLQATRSERTRLVILDPGLQVTRMPR